MYHSFNESIQVDPLLYHFYEKFVFSLFRAEWYQLNEHNKNSFNTNQLYQSVVLTDTFDSIDFWDCSYIDQLNPILAALQINHLIIECRSIPVRRLIKLLHLLPNLNLLKMHSLSFPKSRRHRSDIELQTIDLISKKNNITKVNLEQINKFKEVEFLINLCPHLQYFQVGCSDKVDLKSLVTSILMKTTQIITELRTLCLDVKQPNDGMIKELQDVINHEHWFQNYTIVYINEKIYIQLE